jgi:hypothetical protein
MVQQSLAEILPDSVQHGCAQLSDFQRATQQADGEGKACDQAGETMMEKPDKSDSQANKPVRRYSPPRLTRFGKVRELTTGGSGTVTENKPGQGSPNRRP